MSAFEKAYKERPFLFGKNPTEELLYVIEKFDISGNALELGCGDGRDTYYVIKKGLTVTAVDQSFYAIETLKNRDDFNVEEKKRLLPICENVSKLPLTAETYDFIYAVTLLDHLTEEDISVLSARIMSALKTNGYLFFKVHTIDDVGNTGESVNVSEFSSEIKHFYSHEELLQTYNSYGRTLFYLEASELDLDHGNTHTHAFASILLRKEEQK